MGRYCVSFHQCNYNISVSDIAYVEALPDTTQYQMMRLMLATCHNTLQQFFPQPWNHLRVINLSDICEPDKRVFMRYIESPQLPFYIGKFHSLFGRYRCTELPLLLNGLNRPIICAWGVGDTKYTEIIGQACSLLPQYGRMIRPYPRDYHPMYHQRTWFCDALRSLIVDAGAGTHL